MKQIINFLKIITKRLFEIAIICLVCLIFIYLLKETYLLLASIIGNYILSFESSIQADKGSISLIGGVALFIFIIIIWVFYVIIKMLIDIIRFIKAAWKKAKEVK